MAETRSPTAHDTRFSEIWFQEIGASDWTIIPGLGSWREEVGDTPTNEVATNRGAAVLTSTPPVSTLSLDLPALAVGHPSTNALRAHRRAGTLLRFQVFVPEIELLTGSSTNTLDIGTDGVVSTSGSEPDFDGEQFDVGVSFVVGGVAYVVESIDSGVATVANPPMTAISDESDWVLKVPAFRFGPFTAKVVGGTAIVGELGSAISSTLSLQPNVNPPDPVILPSGTFA